MISEKNILNTFKHLINKSDAEGIVVVGSGDDAAVLDTKEKNLVHSVDISKIDTHTSRKIFQPKMLHIVLLQ